MKNMLFYYLKKFFFHKNATTSMEYGIIVSLTGLGLITSLKVLGVSVNDKFDCIGRGITGNGLCNGAQQTATHDVTTGWGSQLKVKAGDTYEVTVPNNFKFSLWDNVGINSSDWFRPDQNLGRFDNIGMAAVISDSPLGTQFISDITDSSNVYYKTLDNFSKFENGKITITAKKDGYLSTGIVDINGSDNWATTDNGVTRSRDMQITLKRTN